MYSQTNLSLGGDDFALTDPLALGGHGQRLLQLLTEDNILDEHALDLYAPASRDVLDDLADALRDLLATLDDVLQDARADDVTQGGLRALDEGLADVGDTEGGLVRAHNVVVDDGGEVKSDVVLGHADLLGDLDNLDLDVDLDETLRKWVDLDETGVDGLVEAAELGDEADVALVHVLVRIRAANTAWDSTDRTDDGT